MALSVGWSASDFLLFFEQEGLGMRGNNTMGVIRLKRNKLDGGEMEMI